MGLWRAWLAVLVALALLPGLARADGVPRPVLGFGRLFTNDYIGDGHDRWRSGSHLWSLVTGPPWTGAPPPRFGELLEFRLRSEIVSPWRIRAGRADRPYVGALSFGLHSHARRGLVDLVAGADLVLVGPQTGLADFQTRFHDAFGLRSPTGTDHQIADSLLLGLAAEAARPLALPGGASLRPFAEIRAGPEALLRLGADLLVGPGAAGALWGRDVTTGHLVHLAGARPSGVLGIVGWDVALVGDSRFLPEGEGYAAEDIRWRARSGLLWRFGAGGGLFYGLTWLSPEFGGQAEGQLLGALRLDFNF